MKNKTSKGKKGSRRKGKDIKPPSVPNKSVPTTTRRKKYSTVTLSALGEVLKKGTCKNIPELMEHFGTSSSSPFNSVTKKHLGITIQKYINEKMWE